MGHAGLGFYMSTLNGLVFLHNRYPSKLLSRPLAELQASNDPVCTYFYGGLWRLIWVCYDALS